MTSTPQRYAQYAAHTKCPVAHAVAHALGPDYRDDTVFNWDFVSPDGLSMRDAWAMATRWNARLRGHVSVSVDERRAAFSVLETYEWVDVWLGCGSREEAEETARAAREATLVWRTLEKCQGFGASENAVFWKLLFSELQKPKEGESACLHVFESQYVTDTVAFFKDVAFPRVRLHFSDELDADGIEGFVKVFCGISRTVVDEEVARMMTTLSGVVLRGGSDLIDPIELTLRINLSKIDEVRVNSLLTAINSTDANDASSSEMNLECPAFLVKVLDAEDVWSRFCSAGKMDGYLAYGKGVRIPISIRSMSRDGFESLPECIKFRDYLLWALRVNDDTPGGIQQLRFRHRDDDFAISAICSAIPHTRSLVTLNLDTYDHWNNEINQTDAAWLGYALFHPESAASTWNRLQFTQLYSRDGNKMNKMIELMSRGNNLRAALGLSNETDVVDAYFTATIRAGTVMLDEPGDEDAVVATLDSATKVDVCVTSTDVRSLGEWVFAVLPGYGKAWISSSDIEGIEARPPGRPFLTALSFSACSFDLDKVIELCGSDLAFVDVTGLDQTIVTGIVLPVIRSCCQHIQSLRVRLVSEDGRFSQSFLPTQLRELHLGIHIDAKSLSLSGSALEELCNLESLVVTANHAPWGEVVSDFIVPLLRKSPRLRYFQWKADTPNYDLYGDLSYLQRRFVSAETFSQINMKRDITAVIKDHAPTQTVVALLSAIEWDRREGGGSLGRLDRSLIEEVSAFIGDTCERELVVQGTWFQYSDARRE